MKKIALAALLLAGWTGTTLASSYDDLNAGIQHYNQGQWEAAIGAFDKALAANDLVPDLQFIALYDRATSRTSLGQLDPALADYTAALALRPNEAQVLVDRSSVYFRSGKYEQAGPDIERLIGLRPAFAHAYGLRALLNVKRGEMEQSRQDFKTSVKLASKNIRNQSFGIVNWLVGEVDAADDIFSDLARRGTNKTYAWLWYALTQARLGKSVPQGVLPDIDLATWPGPIISFFLGKAPQDSVFTAANQGDASARDGQVCEANFYVGEWLWQHHDLAAAKLLLDKAAAGCPTNFIEWMPAQFDSAALK
jgi:lipoprotein NlpI